MWRQFDNTYVNETDVLEKAEALTMVEGIGATPLLLNYGIKPENISFNVSTLIHISMTQRCFVMIDTHSCICKLLLLI
jgi:hypothetical protein